MLSQSIWLASITLEVLLLARGLQQRLISRFPVFYAYILFVFVSEIGSLLTRPYSHPYVYWYWITEFLGLALGCGVVFEFYRIGLTAFPGTARMARALLAIVFLIAAVKTVVATASVPVWWIYAKPVQVEGALRVCQALAIISLAVIFWFYAIPAGKQLRGILLGYGLFVSWSVVCLTFAAAGPDKSQTLWSYTYSASYLIALALWTSRLWSYQPGTVPAPASLPVEDEYEHIAAATHRRLENARGYLAKAVGS